MNKILGTQVKARNCIEQFLIILKLFTMSFKLTNWLLNLYIHVY